MSELPANIRVTVNGRDVQVAANSVVAVAIAAAGELALRHSVNGEPRGPLCGMGVCYECRVTVDGMPQRLACQVRCRDGMQVTTT